MKLLLKRLLDFLFVLILLPLFLLYLIARLAGSQDSVTAAFAQFLSLFPGKTGNFLRKNFFRFTLSYCSRDCLIGFGTLFSHADTEIGENVYIGPQCNIGKSHIGNGCLLGSGVHILSGKSQHHFDQLDVPIQEQGGHYEKVSIGEDTWIGNGSLIMANIGKKCVIGAGSVVTQDIPDYSIAAGNPAKPIKSRNS